MRMDSLSALGFFVRAAEARSFTEAGRLLSVSSSAVGKTISRLEDRLGVRLFHRNTRAITLTRAPLIFVGAVYPVIGMGIALEAGKLSAVAWLGWSQGSPALRAP
jgi:DNA-binding transcriptional LysR family regulator